MNVLYIAYVLKNDLPFIFVNLSFNLGAKIFTQKKLHLIVSHTMCNRFRIKVVGHQHCHYFLQLEFLIHWF